MPFIHLRIAGRRLAMDQVAQLQRDITALMVNALGKRADLTSVLVEEVSAAGWSVGGRPVVVAAHLEAKVTAETNSAAEKARFLHAAHALLEDLLGPDLPVATYVVVDEIRGDAWGYGGASQADRASR